MSISQTLSKLSKIKIVLIIIVVLFVLGGGLFYLYNHRNSFNIENVKTMLDKANSLVGQTAIQWTAEGDSLHGHLKIDDNSYITYILNKTTVYSETNFTSIGDDLSKLPCLDFAPIFTPDELKKIYKEILQQNIKVNTEKELKVSDNLYLFYSYKQEKNITNVVCKIFYKIS